MVILKRVKPLSVAKMLGALHAIMGLVVGVPFLILGLLIPGDDEGLVFSVMFGVGAPIALAIFYGVIGFIMGAIASWSYNFLAKHIGGLELEFVDKETPLDQSPLEENHL